MKSMTSLLSAVTTAVVAAGAALAIAGPAAAAATTPADAITKDPNASNGTLAFYDTSGTQVTQGSDLTHLFDYALASTAGRAAATKATLYFAFPDHTKDNSTTWFKSQRSLSTTYPNAAAPEPLKSSTNPLVTLKSTDGNLAALLPTTTLDKTDGYDGIVQVRAYDAGAGAPQQSAPFWASAIYFDQAANTWQQVFPKVVQAPTATSTTVTANPASPSTAGTAVTFTATVSPAAAGTVQFKDGSDNLGTAQTVNNGSASVTTSSLTAGTHSITAVFTPADTTAFSGSTSSATSYVVNPAAASTTTTLSVTPAGPADAGTTETLTATVSPAAAAGTVTFKDGSTTIGSPVTVSNGTASTTTTLAPGTHSLTAAFTPTDAAAYTASTSSAQSYTVNQPAATATTTTVTADPAGPVEVGTKVAFQATVSPAAAAGSVQFKDGDTLLGDPVTVSNGVATYSTSALTTGTHSITAVFTPADAGTYSASTSASISIVVNAKATTTTLTVSPDSPADFNTQQTLTATVSPSAAAGTVTFKDGDRVIGSPVTVVAGSATTTTTLGAGDHSLTAVFTPSDTATYAGSTSAAVTYSVAQPPVATTTSVAANLASPQRAGTDITFTATVTPATAAGTVTFKSDGTTLGSDVVTNGAASLTTAALTKGSHQITAEFTPSDPKKAGASTSTAITYVIAESPAAPTNVAATAGNQSATVTWTAPTDDGGSPVTGYDVQYSTDGLNWTTTNGETRTSTATSVVVTGLTNGVGYLFRVRALNAVPAGASSYAVSDTAVAPKADNTTVTISAPASASYNSVIAVTGSVTNARTGAALAGVKADLYQRVARTGAYTLVGSATTDAKGAARVLVRITNSTEFGWRIPATNAQNAGASAVRSVTVPASLTIIRSAATVKVGQTVKIYGAATPLGTGDYVTLQQFANGRWTSLGSVKIARQTMPNGKAGTGYQFARKLTAKGVYSYRVYKPSTAANTGAYSATASVRAA